MKIRCVVLATLGLSALPSVGSAGPLSLGYHAEVLDNTGTRLTLPADGTIVLEQQTDRSWKGSVNVFWPQDSYFPDNLPANPTDGQFYSYTNDFRVRLTVTDPTSGQSGTVALSGVEQGGWE